MKPIHLSTIALLLLSACSHGVTVPFDDPIASIPLGMAYDSLTHRMRSTPGIDLLEEHRYAHPFGMTHDADALSGYDSTEPSRKSGSVRFLTYKGGYYHDLPVIVWSFTFIDSQLASATLSLSSAGEANTADVAAALADEFRRLHPPIADEGEIDRFIHDDGVRDGDADPRGSHVWRTKTGDINTQVTVEIKEESIIWIRYQNRERMIETFGHERRIFTLPE